jgi:hypothetical protein
MVAGDVVSGISAAGPLTFQPALTVEVALTSAGSFSIDHRLTDGVAFAFALPRYPTSGIGNIKMMINNAIYLNLQADANGVSYTGIQIK